MTDNYTDIVVDGELHSGSFRGVGVYIGKNMLRKFLTYKKNFPQSYEKINDLLFKKGSGAAFTHLRISDKLTGAAAYIEDVKALKPDIIIDSSDIHEEVCLNSPKFAVNADGSGLCGEGSVTALTEKLIVSRPSVLYFDAEDAIDTDGVWSGEFYASHLILSIAHITAFSEVGWDFADGNTDGDYMALSSNEGEYSIIFVNKTDSPRKYSICVRCMGNADGSVHCIETKGPEGSDRFYANWFKLTDKILPFKKSYGYCYNVEVKPYSVMTCTTLSADAAKEDDLVFTSGGKNLTKLPYLLESDDGILPVRDVFGGFEIKSFEGRTVIEHTGSDKESRACTVFGSRLMTEYKLVSEVQLCGDAEENYAGICVFCDKNGKYGNSMTVSRGGFFEITDCRGRKVRLKTDAVSDILPNKLEICASDGLISYKINDQNVYNADNTVTPAVLSGYCALISASEGNSFEKTAVFENNRRFPYGLSHDCLGGSFKYSENWVKNGYADDDFIHRTCVSANAEGEFFELDFTGENIALLGKTHELRAKIEIDGTIIKAGSISNDDCLAHEVFFAATNLPNKQHTLRLTILSGSLELNGAKAYASGPKPSGRHRMIVPVRRKEEKPSSVRLGTLLVGGGLAAAGLGAVIFGRIIRKRKNRKNR